MNATDSGDDGKINVDEAAEFAETEQQEWDLPDHKSDKFEKKKMHEHMFEDPWHLGWQSFAKKDVLKIRAEGERRRAKKSVLRQAILRNIATYSSEKNVVVGVEKEGIPQW